jgi:hypothetical protein
MRHPVVPLTFIVFCSLLSACDVSYVPTRTSTRNMRAPVEFVQVTEDGGWDGPAVSPDGRHLGTMNSSSSTGSGSSGCATG